MTDLPIAHPESPLSTQSHRYRRWLFGTCLAISVALHIATVVVLLLTKSTTRQPVVSGFIEMKDFAVPHPPATPEIRKPAPSPDHQEPQQIPAPASTSEAAEHTEPAAPAGQFAEVLATPLGRGMANGFFTTLAEGRSLHDDIRGYYFELLERVNDRWWQKAATLKESAWRNGVAEVVIGRDGTLYQVRLVNDTGSSEVDRAIIEVLSGASPFSPLPASYGPELFNAPLKFTAPSNLFRSIGGK